MHLRQQGRQLVNVGCDGWFQPDLPVDAVVTETPVGWRGYHALNAGAWEPRQHVEDIPFEPQRLRKLNLRQRNDFCSIHLCEHEPITLSLRLERVPIICEGRTDCWPFSRPSQLAGPRLEPRHRVI